jgi:hypothetical protein
MDVKNSGGTRLIDPNRAPEDLSCVKAAMPARLAWRLPRFPSGAGENGSPQHALDNNGGIDAVRITFSDSVRLTGVTFGWA